MVDVAALSNDELRTLLAEHGKSVGPVGPSTRKLYEKQLVKLMAGGGGDTSLLNVSSKSEEPVVRTSSPTRAVKAASRAKSAAAAAATAHVRQDDYVASSDEERGEESMRYLDEEEQEEYRRQLSPQGSPVFKNGVGYEVAEQKRGGVSTVALVVALLLLGIFTVFLLMRSLDMDGDKSNHEEL